MVVPVQHNSDRHFMNFALRYGLQVQLACAPRTKRRLYVLPCGRWLVKMVSSDVVYDLVHLNPTVTKSHDMASSISRIIYLCTSARKLHKTRTSKSHIRLFVYDTANPTWGAIFECCFKARSSKLESLFSLKRGKRDVRALSFELSKMSPQVGLAVQRRGDVVHCIS